MSSEVKLFVPEGAIGYRPPTPDEIRAAVAAYLDPTEVEWCTTHNISAFTDLACWQGASLALNGEPHGCQIETKYLLDPLVKNAYDEEE